MYANKNAMKRKRIGKQRWSVTRRIAGDNRCTLILLSVCALECDNWSHQQAGGGFSVGEKDNGKEKELRKGSQQRQAEAWGHTRKPRHSHTDKGQRHKQVR
jgi:hypothetical protein